MKIEPNPPALISQLRIKMDCPYCNTFTKITLDDYTSKGTYIEYKLRKLGSIYHCESCLEPLFLLWNSVDYSGVPPRVAQPEFIGLAIPKSNLTYVAAGVKKEYMEALKCYGISCYNAFAAMCRRTIQKICEDKEIKGTSKLKKQIEELKKEFNDPEISEMLDALVISCHDGAHPHLPEIDDKRAAIILALMNDLLDQIYNRPGRIAEAKELRKQKITNKKST